MTATGASSTAKSDHSGGPEPEATGARATAMFERPSNDVRSLAATGTDTQRPHRSPPLRRILVAVDLVAVAIGWGFVLLYAFSTGAVVFGPLTTAAQSVMMLGAGLWLLSASGLYRRRISAIRSVEVARIGRVSVALAVLSVVVLASLGREFAVIAGVIGGISWFLLLTLERGVFREWISGRRASGHFGASVLVVGGGSASTLATARFLDDNPVLGFRVQGVACPSASQLHASRFSWYGAPVDMLERTRASGASGVVIDSNSLAPHELNEVVEELGRTGLHVQISSGLRGVDGRRVNVSSVADEIFLDVTPLGLTRRQVQLKRGVDVLGAGVALVLASPILLVTALLVWAGDRGPVLFSQERVGKDGEPFRLFKLRTMVRDAERLRAQLEADNERSGPLFKLGHDPRITRVGRFLRSSSIDEIPQLFNVLEGTMSLVGPRPALPGEVAQFDERLNVRLTVKPGMTGLWQVEARDLPSFDLYRRYDLLYVQNWSFGVDLAVIARTIVVVTLRAGRALWPGRSTQAELSS